MRIKNDSHQAKVDPPSWDRSVFKRTQDFVYEDSTVWLQVENTKFSVSRRRLTTVSPVFEGLFSLPHISDEPTILHHSATDFKHFLWYLHVDYFEFADYLQNCPIEQRVHRSLSIARLAHFYEASTILAWALKELTSLLPSSNVRDSSTLKCIYVFARDASKDLLDKLNEHWCQQVRSSADPVDWLIAARDVDDKYLQAYAYFHILNKTNAQLHEEKRLSTLDKLRLSMGTINLRRYQQNGCGCNNPYSYGHRCGQTQDPDQWSPKVTAPLQVKYGNESLWDMFAHSPMGFDLADGTDLITTPAEVKCDAVPSDK
ncbi:hypothetical protein BKA62DRAFT_159082 [Auriculariales sp. MPI-PUGE-AT-0066]|nr:hypothetical protein BKA62DRAFT_159082 [Auriculariales sp. MPI-PUGE-AT-0066]